MHFWRIALGALCISCFAGLHGLAFAEKAEYNDPLSQGAVVLAQEVGSAISGHPDKMPSFPNEIGSTKEWNDYDNQINRQVTQELTKSNENLQKSFKNGLTDAEGKTTPRILRQTLEYIKHKHFRKAFALCDAVLLSQPLIEELDIYWIERLLLLANRSFMAIEAKENPVAFSAAILKIQNQQIPELVQDTIWESSILEDMAQRYADIGKYQAALELRLLRLQKLEGKAEHVERLDALNQLAMTYLQTEKYEEVPALAQEVLAYPADPANETNVFKDRARNIWMQAASASGNMDVANQLSTETLSHSYSIKRYKVEQCPGIDAYINVMDSTAAIAKYFFRTKEYQKALQWCQDLRPLDLQKALQMPFFARSFPRLLSEWEYLESVKLDKQDIIADVYNNTGQNAHALALCQDIVNSRCLMGSAATSLLHSYRDRSDNNMHRSESLRSLLSLVREYRIAGLYEEADVLAKYGFARAKERWGSSLSITGAYQDEINRIQLSENVETASPPLASLNELEKRWEFYKDYPLDVRRAAYARMTPSYKAVVEQLISEHRDDEAFQTAELCKSRFLLEMFSMQLVENLELLSDEDHKKFQGLQRNLLQAETNFKKNTSMLQNIVLGHGMYKELADIYLHSLFMEKSRTRTAYRFNAFCRELEAKYPAWKAAADYRPISLQEGMTFLPDRTAYVSFLQLAPKRVMVIVLDKVKGFHALPLELPWDLSEKSTSYHELISYPDLFEIEREKKFLWRLPGQSYRITADSDKKQPKAVQITDIEEFNRCRLEMAADLGKNLLDPIRPYVSDNTSSWVISPDNALAIVPFESLMYQGEPLILSADVSYGQSLSALKLLKDRHDNHPRQQERSLFALGNPRYDKLDDPTQKQLAKNKWLGSRLYSYNWLFYKEWDNLLSAGCEIDEVANSFPDFNRARDSLTGEQATRHNFLELNKDGSLAQYKYLLFATHGVFMPTIPEFSALIVRRDNAVTDEGSGVLTTLNLMGLHLNSDLVYLSACETGLGSYTTGEGVFGLPLAFNIAGNQDTVMSLWKIDDKAAASFSMAFFKRLANGVPPVKALSAVKREWLRPPKGEFSDAFFWAPMILYGLP